MFAMPQLHLIFLSLFVSSVLFPMEPEKKPIPRKSMFPSPMSNRVDCPHEPQKKTNHNAETFIQKNEEFDEDDIRNMDQVFNNAPKRAQNIVKHLKNRNFLRDGSYRSIVFVGIPGSGKTTLAKAIAYKMVTQAGWKYACISSSSLLKEHRNQTAIHLNQIFNEIISNNEQFILIIDELNLLLENSDSKHHDTDATSKAIWSFLDSRKNKHNFFFIGTMNRVDKLPQPFKSRILFRCIKFGPLTDINQKNQILRDKLEDEYTQFADEVTNENLNIEIQKIKDCTGRDLEEFASALKRVYRDHDDDENNKIIIGNIHIQEVMSEYLETYTFMKYDKIEETDEERSERHYEGNINNQNKLHQENKDMQEKHFIQQQWAQLIMSTQEIYKEARVKNILTNEQKQIITTIINQNNASRPQNNDCIIQ